METTRPMAAIPQEKDDLGRAAAFLIGIHPDRMCASNESSSIASAAVDGRNLSFPRITRLPQSFAETPMTSMKSQTDDEHNGPTPLSCAEDNIDISPPLGPSFHPCLRQVSFLSTVGEMAKRVSQQGRHVEPRHATGPVPTYPSRDSCADMYASGAPVAIENLVRAEGQRVRMRLVPIVPEVKSCQQLQRHDAEEAAATRNQCYGAPTTLCTILSSFAPPQASYWQDDRLVQPYLGERCDQVEQRRRGGRGDDSGGSGDDDWSRGPDSKVGFNSAMYSGETVFDYENNEDSSSKSINDGDDNENEDVADGIFKRVGPCGRSASSKRRGGTGGELRSYGKLITHHRCRLERVFYDAYFLDKGNITGGERRKKLIVLPSYRASVISFVDRKVFKKDINSDFYVQHPELEIREIKLTHIQAIRADLLNFALEEGSPIDVVTVAHANWYFERLIMRGMVGKRNRRLMLAVCVLLAIKFVETGDIQKKINYAKTHFRQDETFAGVTWQKVQECEFRVYVGLDFTLMPEKGNCVVETHLERLIGQNNVTLQEYYSKNFAIR